MNTHNLAQEEKKKIDKNYLAIKSYANVGIPNNKKAIDPRMKRYIMDFGIMRSLLCEKLIQDNDIYLSLIYLDGTYQCYLIHCYGWKIFYINYDDLHKNTYFKNDSITKTLYEKGVFSNGHVRTETFIIQKFQDLLQYDMILSHKKVTDLASAYIKFQESCEKLTRENKVVFEKESPSDWVKEKMNKINNANIPDIVKKTLLQFISNNYKKHKTQYLEGYIKGNIKWSNCFFQVDKSNNLTKYVMTDFSYAKIGNLYIDIAILMSELILNKDHLYSFITKLEDYFESLNNKDGEEMDTNAFKPYMIIYMCEKIASNIESFYDVNKDKAEELQKNLVLKVCLKEVFCFENFVIMWKNVLGNPLFTIHMDNAYVNRYIGSLDYCNIMLKYVELALDY